MSFCDGREDNLVDGITRQALRGVAHGVFGKPAHEESHHVRVGREGGLVVRLAEPGELAPVGVVGGAGAAGLVMSSNDRFGELAMGLYREHRSETRVYFIQSVHDPRTTLMRVIKLTEVKFNFKQSMAGD